MNKLNKTLFVLILLMITIIFNISKVNALSQDDLTNPTFSIENNGFSYKETKTSSGIKQAMYYAEYNANASSKYEWVIHSKRSGSVTTRTTVLDIAKDYEQSTGQKVIFAANGDYFDLNSGSNMESYVNNGIVISKGSFITKHCIGFDNKGKVAIGRMTEVEKRLMVVINGETKLFNIDKFNSEPLNNEIAIYNQLGTYNINDTGKYIITTSSTSLQQCPVWGVSKRMTIKEKIDSESFTLKSGQFAIVCKDSDINNYFYENIKYGVEVNIVEIPAGDFKDCTWVLGGYDILVNNYQVNTSCHTDNDGSGKAPRTFIGFKEDGTCFVCVVDGRQPSHSVGITVNEEAQLSYSLGAKYALELDGGGSSTVILRVDDVLTLRSKPSDGSMRTVSNAIMLVEKKINEDDNNNDDNKNNEPIKKSGCMSSNASEFIISTISLTCLASCMLIVSKMKRGR